MKKMIALWSDCRANVLVESALSLSVFLMLLFGVCDFGRLVWTYNLLAHGAREGVRYAVVRGNTTTTPATASDVSTYAKNQMLGISGETVNVTWSPDNSPGNPVNVNVTYSFVPVTFFAPSFTVRSRAQSIVIQ